MSRLLLIGGGLANSLIAWRIRQRLPGVELIVLEAGPSLGGNHTWSFHDADLTREQRTWLAPLVEHRWTSQAVHFPDYVRTLSSSYSSLSSTRLHRVIGSVDGIDIRLQTPVDGVRPDGVIPLSGEPIEADAVIDGRGFGVPTSLQLGWQEFVGVELECASPHGVSAPVIMDSTVGQHGAFCFVYLLPFSATRLLVEYTRYADTPSDRGSMQDAAFDYARDKGWSAREVRRIESGCLPIALDGDFDAFWPRHGPPVARSGLRAALFHPTTGYSLPDAVRLADLVASTIESAGPRLTPRVLHDCTRQMAESYWNTRAFYRALNRMLFQAARPAERIKIFSRFYRLAPSLIERFYAARSTPLDKARILTGRPPIPMGRALKAFLAV